MDLVLSDDNNDQIIEVDSPLLHPHHPLKPQEADVCAVPSTPDAPSDFLHTTLTTDAVHPSQTSPSDLRTHATNCLSSLGIRIDPIYHLTICMQCHISIDHTHIHAHIKSNHPLPHYAKSTLPPKEKLLDLLVLLQADEPLSVLPGPIHAIPGLPIVNAIKCDIIGCTDRPVLSDTKRFSEHCLDHHPQTPIKKRTFVKVKAHPINNFRNMRQHVDVITTDQPSISNLLAIALHHSQTIGLYDHPSVFHPSANAHPRGALFAHTKWEGLILGVDLTVLRATVSNPDKQEVAYCRLITQTQEYYSGIAPLISMLPILTARCIASSAELESQPFRSPQETTTVQRYSRFIALFIIFLLCHLHCPVPRFHIHFHSNHIDCLSSLRDALSLETPCHKKIHLAVVSLLQYISVEATANDHRDLFTLFLLVYHLTDDSGNTTHISAVPPNISAAQWCFRATTTFQVLDNAKKYEGDTFTYVWSLLSPPSFLTSIHIPALFKPCQGSHNRRPSHPLHSFASEACIVLQLIIYGSWPPSVHMGHQYASPLLQRLSY
jgi:hypothetical protein